jgi:transposase
MSIPGFKLITAWSIVAEMGTDMSVFPDAAHAASWAGLAPGNNQSGGKRRSGRTNKGNRWLRRALVQSAWAVSHKGIVRLMGMRPAEPCSYPMSVAQQSQ